MRQKLPHLRLPPKVKTFFSSFRTKFLLSYLTLSLAVLILVNTYPLFVVRNLTFSAKQTSLENQASLISTAISSLDSISPDNVIQVLRLLDMDGLNRIYISDTDGFPLYDAAHSADMDTMKTWGLERALSGKQAFFCRFADDAYHSSAAMPLYSSDGIDIGRSVQRRQRSFTLTEGKIRRRTGILKFICRR